MSDEDNMNEILRQAMDCDNHPDWLRGLIDDAAQYYVVDLDMSTEQAIALAVLLHQSRNPFMEE